MKKHRIITLFVFLAILCAGCATFKTISFKELSDFKSEIKKKYNYIDDLKVDFYQGGFNFDFSLNKKADKKELDDVAEETKKFFTNSKIESKFKEIYKEAFDDQYPNVYVSFKGQNKLYEGLFKQKEGKDDYSIWDGF